MNAIEALTQEHFRAVIEKRIDDIVSHYRNSDQTYVFIEGPRWSTQGIDRINKGWNAYIDAPLSVQSVRYVEGPLAEVSSSGDLAWIAGIVELAVSIAGNVKTIRFRSTFVFRKEADGHWRIEHEHFSQPAEDPYGIGDWLERPPK
jgi:ketosteroid isomerase-like protein